jgi:hypothetical protein
MFAIMAAFDSSVPRMISMYFGKTFSLSGEAASRLSHPLVERAAGGSTRPRRSFLPPGQRGAGTSVSRIRSRLRPKRSSSDHSWSTKPGVGHRRADDEAGQQVSGGGEGDAGQPGAGQHRLHELGARQHVRAQQGPPQQAG